MRAILSHIARRVFSIQLQGTDASPRRRSGAGAKHGRVDTRITLAIDGFTVVTILS